MIFPPSSSHILCGPSKVADSDPFGAGSAGQPQVSHQQPIEDDDSDDVQDSEAEDDNFGFNELEPEHVEEEKTVDSENEDLELEDR